MKKAVLAIAVAGAAVMCLGVQCLGPMTYTVTYLGNGNTGGTVPTDTNNYVAGATVAVADVGSLVYTGHGFAGWNTASNGSGTEYAPGTTFAMGAADITLYAQWEPSGSADVGFGTNGVVTTDIGASDSGNAVAVESDGTIVVAGTSDSDFALARYNADGSLDASFDADGKVTTDIGSSSSDWGSAAAIQADGKIVVAGTSANDFALVRYNTDGSLDTTFDTDGKVTTDIGTSTSDGGNAVAIQSDGKIVVAGTSGIALALARYNTDGSLDTSFGTDGKVTAAIVGQQDIGRAVAIQSDGKIVVAGTARTSGVTFDVFVARHNTDGSLDASFDTDGKVTTDFGTGNNSGRAVAIQSDGKIIVAGSSSDQFALARYNTDGSLDTSYDTDGMVTTAIGVVDAANAVTIQSDGKIVVAGETSDGTGSVFGLVRYNADGSLDASFDTDGIVITSIGSSSIDDNGNAVAIQSDGRIIVAGISDDDDFSVARYWH